MTTPFWIGVGVGVIACLAVVGLAGLVFYHLGRVLAEREPQPRAWYDPHTVADATMKAGEPPKGGATGGES